MEKCARKVILESTPTTHTVIKESTAWLLTNAMEDVVKIGTGKPCKVEGMSVAGKTGTTTNDYDLWFAGYTPYLTATIWCGYDENAPLSNGSYHEIMWSKIVTRIDEAKGYTEDIGFPMPDSIVSAAVCKTSGNLPIGGSCPTVNEFFAKGTVPKDLCNIHFASNQTPEEGNPNGTDTAGDAAAQSDDTIGSTDTGTTPTQ